MFGLFGGGPGGFGGPGGGRFESSYRCYPVSFLDKPEAERGDKIFLPPSALDRLGASWACRQGGGAGGACALGRLDRGGGGAWGERGLPCAASRQRLLLLRVSKG